MPKQKTTLLVYAAKFVCGVFDPDGTIDTHPEVEGPVRPGSYATAINVHNPNPAADRDTQEGAPAVRKVLLTTPEQAGPPAPTFIKGMVVIETTSTEPIDVVAVYTVDWLDRKTGERSVSMAVERVVPTVVPR